MKQTNKKYKASWRRTRIGSFLFNLKRNRLWLRRFAFIWMFLIVFEIACPVLECRNGDDLLSGSSMSAAAYSDAGCYTEGQTRAFTARFDESRQASHIESTQPAHCGDECLCHVAAIPNLAFNLPANCARNSLSAIESIDTPALSLPPPFQPPKSA